MPIDPSLVIEAYSEFLGRTPETPQSLAWHSANSTSSEDLIRRLAKSDEYRNRIHMEETRKNFYARPPRIDVEVSDVQMLRLMERTREEWRQLGEQDPYWSVLSEEKYRAGKLDKTLIEEFLKTGQDSADLIDFFEAKSGWTARRGTCFELGCGVGRVTYYLSQKFERVVAADISPGNIELCRQNLSAMGVENVEYLLIDDLAEYRDVAEFDFLYSIIVLQHNTPPVQKFVLDQLTRKIRSGGGCFFQVPSSMPNYTFNIVQYLASDTQVIEMHAIPMPTVLRLLQANGLTILEVSPDSWTWSPGSNTYLAFKA